MALRKHPPARPLQHRAAAPPKLLAFDPVRYLTDEAALAEYWAAAEAENDPRLLRLVLADIARARTRAKAGG